MHALRAEHGELAGVASNLQVPGTSFNADVLAGLELAGFPHWLCWNFEHIPDRDKPQKIPKNPHTGYNASSTSPCDWAPLDVAVGRALREGWGVGFVFHATLNPFAGIDLDNCRDPHSGVLTPWAQSIIAAFNSYSEVSPSGCGVKIIVRGKPSHNGKKAGAAGTAIECYGDKRYFALTGWEL
jgi:putative DNA primase/helicase